MISGRDHPPSQNLARYPYGPLASVYDLLARIYSLGRIERSKSCRLDTIRPGMRVLFAGVGCGREAVGAARRGAVVTAIDLASPMLERFSASLRREGLEARCIEGNVAEHQPESAYDLIVAHYFLNLFNATDAEIMLQRLAEMRAPGGRLWIADFSPARGGVLSRWLSHAYYRPINVAAWMMGYCALHPILDYTELLPSVGMESVDVTYFPLLMGGDPAYLSIEAR